MAVTNGRAWRKDWASPCLTTPLACRALPRLAQPAPVIDMTKALFAMSLLALVGATAIAPLSAANGPGICVGICVEVTEVDPADVETVTQTQVQTCAGNVNVQIGVNNEANYCSGGNNTNGGLL